MNSQLQDILSRWQAMQPLSERDRKRLSQRFTVDFNYNSNHIEGNTLTYGQTELLLMFGQVVQAARMRDLEEMKASNVGLLVNYILSRHGYPMVVVRSRKKQEYLEALHQADLRVGPVPSDGACATLDQIKPFHSYFTRLVTDEIKHTIDFLTARDQATWWFDGERITFNSPPWAPSFRPCTTTPMSVSPSWQRPWASAGLRYRRPLSRSSAKAMSCKMLTSWGAGMSSSPARSGGRDMKWSVRNGKGIAKVLERNDSGMEKNLKELGRMTSSKWKKIVSNS